jgi:hypothetical protein
VPRVCQRAVGFVLSRSNDLIDLTVPVLIIEVVNFTPVRARVGNVFLTVHVAFVFARHCFPPMIDSQMEIGCASKIFWVVAGTVK